MSTYRIVESPLGDVLLRATDGALTGLFFSGQKYFPPGIDTAAHAGNGPAADTRVLAQTAEELQAYFAGTLQAFSVPVQFTGSAFQREVWQALRAIAFGGTVSYGQLAATLGLPPSHARAVGGAVGRNPLSVIVPCHRVLGASGALTGYAGGVDRKRALLGLEGAPFGLAS
ncbi:methylated-DNA--[protein]-cysteine S-methyltransferase [Cupriavidus plantarum]|uniref:methylated-DNA--[protein]-cysteine S-methyltransferase n=1 Tax=Cupriavidus plantarum TaxID=942865 RepID=UPI000E258B2D|nr:methylated-DNA--[protein]-cysteine S-methyltransferase [Cupriavidus plantarum]REE88882.1 methylated-DNA-[protein]-cysteine S-methyltransferase [Cupriavidus plantarum]